VTHVVRRRLRPLVGVVCFAPLMAEGVASALEGVADTRLLPAELDDMTALLRTLDPDAIVIDRECRAARAHAEEFDLPLFVVPVEGAGVEVPSPDRLRALVVGSLLAVQVRS
jgi:hypothetical protein